MLISYFLNKFCSTTGHIQNATQKTFGFCWLGLFKYTLVSLKHSSLILLIKTVVMAHFGIVLLNYIFKELLLYNQSHTGNQGTNLCKLLIRSIQTYPIWFGAFQHDFVDREWSLSLFQYCTPSKVFSLQPVALKMSLKKLLHVVD